MIQLTRIVLRMLPAVLVAGFLTAGAAMADDDGGVLSTLIGSSPGQSVGGVPSAGAPWAVSKAHVTLNGGGHFNLVVDGLILPSTGNTGPVSQVSASLVCGGSGGTVVATTGAVALSTSGDAHIHEKITLPASCIAPVVLVRAAVVNGTTLAQPPFIAVSGFNSASTGKGSDEPDSAANQF
jgi:hypothetical protein